MVRPSDVIGKANIDKFTAIQKGLLISIAKGMSGTQALNGLSPDDTKMYKEQLFKLDRCGYEYDDVILIFHGWKSFLVHGELTWYMDTTHRNPKPYVEYISMSAYLDWLKVEDTGEPKQYNVSSMVKHVGREIQKPKARVDIDFPEEREEA